MSLKELELVQRNRKADCADGYFLLVYCCSLPVSTALQHTSIRHLNKIWGLSTSREGLRALRTERGAGAMQSQGYDLQEQGSGLQRLPYPEQVVCLDCWCGAVTIDAGLQLLLHLLPSK